VRVSVIIPTFQRRDLLRRALNAVCAQDFPPSEYEVIVVIDGSQDGTLEMLQELRPSCRLRFLYQENKGQAAAKNAGVQLAEGEILFFLDDDILLPPNALRDHLVKHDGSDQVIFAAIGVAPDSRPGLATEYTRVFAESFYGALERGGFSLFPNYINVLPNSSVPRQLVLNAGGFDERFFRAHEDTELAYRLFKQNVQFRYISGVRAVQVYDKDVRALAREAELDGRQDILFSRLHSEYRLTCDLAPPASRKRRWFLLTAICTPELVQLVVLGLLVLMDRFHSLPRCRRFGIRLLNIYLRAIALRSATRCAGGLRSFLRRFWRRVPALLYHDIVADTADALPGALSIKSDAFARQIRWLKRRGYQGITPSQWRDWCASEGPLPPKPIIITFDDGYASLLVNAFPILRWHQFPATVFVVTREIGGSNTWDQSLQFPVRLLLSADEIRQSRIEGIEFAPHSRTHAHLMACPPEQMRAEVCGSATDLMSVTGVSASSFAYPYGEYDESVREATAACFALAFSCAEGLNDLSTDLFSLRRTMVQPGDSLLDFICRVKFGWNPIAVQREVWRSRFLSLISR
jgi:glycosyltransferase involved in cell wall biosynthesis/peptidoglycan/xylan/chitin deacetylase (PgdA/CDA1 family)